MITKPDCSDLVIALMWAVEVRSITRQAQKEVHSKLNGGQQRYHAIAAWMQQTNQHRDLSSMSHVEAHKKEQQLTAFVDWIWKAFHASILKSTGLLVIHRQACGFAGLCNNKHFQPLCVFFFLLMRAQTHGVIYRAPCPWLLLKCQCLHCFGLVLYLSFDTGPMPQCLAGLLLPMTGVHALLDKSRQE